jgi:hypothetical protein
VAHLHGPAPGRPVGHAALKGIFTDLGRGFRRVMGAKMVLLLGFTFATFNLDRVRISAPSTPQRTRAQDSEAHAENATRRPSKASSFRFEVTGCSL